MHLWRMELLNFFGFLFALLHVGRSLPFTDKCLHPQVVEGFDVHKFEGTWYEILRANTSGDVTTNCHSETYTIPYETFVIVYGKVFDKKTHNCSLIEGVGAVNKENSPTLYFDIPLAKANEGFTVIDTDYKSYAALYSCNTYEFLRLEHFWIVSRERKLKKDIIDKLLLKYKEIGGITSSFVYIDQSNCPEEKAMIKE